MSSIKRPVIMFVDTNLSSKRKNRDYWATFGDKPSNLLVHLNQKLPFQSRSAKGERRSSSLRRASTLDLWRWDCEMRKHIWTEVWPSNGTTQMLPHTSAFDVFAEIFRTSAASSSGSSIHLAVDCQEKVSGRHRTLYSPPVAHWHLENKKSVRDRSDCG